MEFIGSSYTIYISARHSASSCAGSYKVYTRFLSNKWRAVLKVRGEESFIAKRQDVIGRIFAIVMLRGLILNTKGAMLHMRCLKDDIIGSTALLAVFSVNRCDRRFTHAT